MAGSKSTTQNVAQKFLDPRTRMSDKRLHQHLKTLLTEDGKKDPDWKDIRARMIVSSCAYMAQELLRGPPEAPYHGRFIVASHHLEWDELVMRHPRVCVQSPRDHGKCAVRGSLVLRSDGQRIPIEQWSGGMVLAYNPATFAFEQAFAPGSQPNGMRPCIRIRTRTGRTETVTENHPLRTLDGWIPSDKLAIGDRIAVPKKLPNLGQDPVPDAWLMGLAVGDGGMTGPSLTITTADVDVLAAMEAEVDRNGWQTRQGSGIAWAKQHGMDILVGDKRVPNAIFSADTASICEFLSGYLDSDAHVSLHAGGSVEFYSVSEALLTDVRHLLTRLGIVAVLTNNDGTHHSFRLTVRGRSLVVLAEMLRPRGSRRHALAALLTGQIDIAEGDTIDLLPIETCNWINHSENWFRDRGHPRYSRKYALTRTKAKALADAEDNPRLGALADSDVMWDEIVELNEVGVQETWGLCVLGLENYVGQDVVNHNTFFFNMAYPIWKAITTPGGSGYIFSATKDQAKDILDAIKSEIENNPKLQWLYPRDSKRVWSATHIKLANGHHIRARGFGTRVRGGHPNWIVVDDGLNDESAYSDTVRRKQIEYFYAAITNMIIPGGQIVVVGTPFHNADLYGDLRRNHEYVFKRYKALNEDGTSLWPMRYSVARLEARRTEIGSIRFAREFQCEPIADEMSLFPKRLFRGEPVEQMLFRLGMPGEYWDELGVTRYMGVDFAISSNVGADYTIIWTMGVDKPGNRWIVDIFRQQGMPYQDQLSEINRMGRLYEPAVVMLEANQMQRIFGDELIRTTDLPIRKHTTGLEKHALDKGVPSLRVLLENGKFRIPRGDKRSVELTDVWIDEMHNFTYINGKLQSVGGHDDTVMACWLCNLAIQLGGFSFSFGEDVDLTTMDPEVDEDGNRVDIYGMPIERPNRRIA